VTKLVHDSMCCRLRPRPKVHERDQFRQWINDRSPPEHLGSIAQACAQFF
jgi:hypothetical protein